MKSPGIKPRRHNSNSSSSSTLGLSNTLQFNQKSLHLSSNEGEQSPPAANLAGSIHEISVFANVAVGATTNNFISQSRVSLNTISTSITDISDSISVTAPEIPRRSNSIISMTSHGNTNLEKPLLSPRTEVTSSPSSSFSIVKFAQQTVSPKMLDSLNEETSLHGLNGQPPTVSPRTDRIGYGGQTIHAFRGGCRTNSFNTNEISERSSPSYTSSPKTHNNAVSEEVNALPISPHVNVPNAQSFNHLAPPLPPRQQRRKNTPEAQVR